MPSTYSWPPPTTKQDYSKQGRDHAKKAVIAFMNAGEYQNAIEMLHALEQIDEDEPSDTLKAAAERYLYGDWE